MLYVLIYMTNRNSHLVFWSYSRSDPGMAFAAEINEFMLFGYMLCLSTHLYNLVAYRLPWGLGFRGGYELTLLYIGQRALKSHHRFLYLVMDSCFQEKPLNFAFLRKQDKRSLCLRHQEVSIPALPITQFTCFSSHIDFFPPSLFSQISVWHECIAVGTALCVPAVYPQRLAWGNCCGNRE